MVWWYRDCYILPTICLLKIDPSKLNLPAKMGSYGVGVRVHLFLDGTSDKWPWELAEKLQLALCMSMYETPIKEYPELYIQRYSQVKLYTQLILRVLLPIWPQIVSPFLVQRETGFPSLVQAAGAVERGCSKRSTTTGRLLVVFLGGSSRPYQNWYCWWKKSCTSWYGKYPFTYKVSCMLGGAGFLPPTVLVWHIFNFHPHLGKSPILTSIFFKGVELVEPTT